MSNIINISDNSSEIASELPKSYSTRWNASRKAAVVRAVQAGVISLNKALSDYRLSWNEFSSWQESYAASGERGLRAKVLHHHR